MKILFIFTGGTIGSTQSDDVIFADAQKSYKIIRAYAQKYALDFAYDVVEPYTELSENNTGATIRDLCACVRSQLDKGYDGMIVTHGTDTLQYSAAALGYLLGLSTPPVCLVSANRPIESESTNALDNLHAAITFIREGAGQGVFVPYRNENSATVQVHRGTRLIAGKAYGDDVCSIFNCSYGHFEADFTFVKNPDYREAADECPALAASALDEQNKAVLSIVPYPGMVYPTLEKATRFVMLHTYHSGTINTKSTDALRFLQQARENGVTVFATGISAGPRYAGADLFESLGIIPLQNLSPIAAYMKLWMLCDNAEEDISTLMHASLGGDIAPD